MLRSCDAPAVSNLVASLTDAPIIGTIFAVANFNPRREALSLLAASEPFSVIMARRNDTEKIRVEVKCFFSDLVRLSEPNGV